MDLGSSGTRVYQALMLRKHCQPRMATGTNSGCESPLPFQFFHAWRFAVRSDRGT